MSSRREFVSTLAATGAALSVVGARAAGQQPTPATARPSGRRALDILILGGTGFVGPHVVRAAVAGGHNVSVFNRGHSNDLLPDGVEELIGDRNNDHTALMGRRWDVVIDNSARQNARWVRTSAQLLEDSVDRYLFTSTRSVYSDFSEVGMNEDGPVYEVDQSMVDRDERQSYGREKVLSENEVRAAFGDRTIIVRPGLIVGPGDETDRFSYWPIRVDRGGEMLAPGDPDTPVMYIDVRDLADFYIRLAEDGTTGVYNALGPKAPLSFAGMLYGCRAVTTADVRFTWVDADFLIERGERPYGRTMPMWQPARGNRIGFQQFDLSRPLAAGLTYRPLAVTARDTLDYHYSRPKERQMELRAGLTPEREAELLQEWHAQ
jgi:nucleoside-diphosphate-sugar epimerase